MKSFLTFALGSAGTAIIAIRAVGYLNGPPWLAVLFGLLALGLLCWYSVRMVRTSGWYRRRAAKQAARQAGTPHEEMQEKARKRQN